MMNRDANSFARILLLDDDDTFRQTLARSLRKRCFEVLEASSNQEVHQLLEQHETVDAAVLDLRLSGETGLEIISSIRNQWPDSKIIMLTGYGSIATSVQAIRLGAVDYLAKPADATQVLQTLFPDNSKGPSSTSHKKVPIPSLERVEWEHIQRVLADCDFNISQTARTLGMQRRTLQRKLQKFPPA